MSTYDAYNLSLRDSTEFTVPTGSGSVTYIPRDETTPDRYVITGDITYAPTGTLK